MSGLLLKTKALSFLSIMILLITATPRSSLSNDQKKCEVIKLSSHWCYKFCEDREIKRLQKYRKTKCQRIKDKEIDIEQANYKVYLVTTKICICKKTEIGDRCKQWLQKMKAPQQVVLVFKKFCADSKKAKDLSHTVPWLERELFCQIAYTSAYPDSWLSAWTSDFPSVKRFQQQSDKLCEELRNNKITTSEAWYRWQQEMTRFQSNYKSEALRASLKSGYKPFKWAFDVATGLMTKFVP